MEKVLYRTPNSVVSTDGFTTESGESASASTTRPLEPELFYKPISDQDLGIWGHWLPTTHVFSRSSDRFPAEIVHTLTALKAPTEVLEEFEWSRKMDFFQTYEIKTPTRRDLRDPLLIGCSEGKRYPLALWGESLRPFEEIRTLVEKSSVIRNQAMKWNTWLVMSGGLVGGTLGWWLGGQEGVEGSRVGTSIFLAMLGLCVSWLTTWIQTPENKRQNFLDRYRC